MSTATSRGLGVIELLTGEVDGFPLGVLAERLGAGKSSAHRTVTELVELGFIRQDAVSGNYVLGMKIVSLAQRHLARIPLVDLAQTFLDQLAAESGELARLSIVDGTSLIWIAKSEGGRSSLRVDPDAGREVMLSCTASGLAWLSTKSDERALELIDEQGGYPRLDEAGPKAPHNAQEYLQLLHRVREEGFAHVEDTFEVGVAAIAVPVVPPTGQETSYVLNVAGPTARLTAERCHALLPSLRRAVSDMTALSWNHSPRKDSRT